MFWHTLFGAYTGYDPDAVKLSMVDGKPSSGDEIGFIAAKRFAQRSYLTDDPRTLGSDLTGTTLRVGLYDKLVRRVFLGLVKRRPLRALEIFLVEKPRTLIEDVDADIGTLFPFWVVAAGIGIGTAFAIGLVYLPWNSGQARSLGWLLAAMVTASGLPSIAGTPNPPLYLADVFIVWPAAFYIGIPLVGAFVARRLATVTYLNPRRFLSPGGAPQQPKG